MQKDWIPVDRGLSSLCFWDFQLGN